MISQSIICQSIPPSELKTLAVLDTLDLSTCGRADAKSHLVTRINVPREHRGKGVGKALMLRACEAADRDGITLFIEAIPYADCPMTQAELHAWYERCGFTMFGGILRRTPEKG